MVHETNDLEKKKADKEDAIKKWTIEKIEIAKQYIEREAIQKARKMVHGAVYMCQLGENIGSEQNELRPVIVLSNNRMNASSGNVTVAPLSKKVRTKIVNGKEVPRYSSHFILKKEKYHFLDYDSTVKTEDIITVSKIRLKEHLGNIEPENLKRIKNRIKWVFEI